MKHIAIGNSDLKGSRIAYGCWRIAGASDPSDVTPEKEARGMRAVRAAYEAGFTLFDLADVYCDGEAERILGKTLKETSGMRESVQIVTKCGIVPAGRPQSNAPYRYDFSSGHILHACDQALKRLGAATIDLLLLHRPDYLMDPEEVAAAFTQLKREGKAREFGVSNFSPSQFDLLQKACPMPLIANQVEIGLCQLQRFHDGTLDHCLAEGVTPMAWSPLGGGLLLSDDNANPAAHCPPHFKNLRETLGEMAREMGVTRAALAVAWLLKHPSGMMPIVGAVQPEHIQETVRADDVEMTREEWYRLFEAAYGERLP